MSEGTDFAFLLQQKHLKVDTKIFLLSMKVNTVQEESQNSEKQNVIPRDSTTRL